MTPWTIQFIEFSWPEYWNGLPFPFPGDLPNPGIEPRSPTLQADSLPAEPPGKFKDHKLLGNQSSLGKPEAKEVTNSQRKKLTNSGTVLESLRKSSWVLTNQASSIWEASECSGSIFSLRSEGSESQFLGRLIRSLGSPRKREGSRASEEEKRVWNSQGEGKNKYLF